MCSVAQCCFFVQSLTFSFVLATQKIIDFHTVKLFLYFMVYFEAEVDTVWQKENILLEFGLSLVVCAAVYLGGRRRNSYLLLFKATKV